MFIGISTQQMLQTKHPHRHFILLQPSNLRNFFWQLIHGQHWTNTKVIASFTFFWPDISSFVSTKSQLPIWGWYSSLHKQQDLKRHFGQWKSWCVQGSWYIGITPIKLHFGHFDTSRHFCIFDVGLVTQLIVSGKYLARQCLMQYFFVKARNTVGGHA